jgi:hypothetical protein
MATQFYACIITLKMAGLLAETRCWKLINIHNKIKVNMLVMYTFHRFPATCFGTPWVPSSGDLQCGYSSDFEILTFYGSFHPCFNEKGLMRVRVTMLHAACDYATCSVWLCYMQRVTMLHTACDYATYSVWLCYIQRTTSKALLYPPCRLPHDGTHAKPKHVAVDCVYLLSIDSITRKVGFVHRFPNYTAHTIF